MNTSLRISTVVLAASLVAGACQSGGATTTPTAIPTAMPTLLASGEVLIMGGAGAGMLPPPELYTP